jgi:hypothetical protein
VNIATRDTTGAIFCHNTSRHLTLMSSDLTNNSNKERMMEKDKKLWTKHNEKIIHRCHTYSASINNQASTHSSREYVALDPPTSAVSEKCQNKAEFIYYNFITFK